VERDVRLLDALAGRREIGDRAVEERARLAQRHGKCSADGLRRGGADAGVEAACSSASNWLVFGAAR
jgi:hypothetical protein